MNRLKFAFLAASFLLYLPNAAHAQSGGQPPPGSQLPALTARSNLVLVPVLVKSNAAKVVLSLTAEDFILTDNGVPQAVRVEQDALGQPLALAVIVQTGGQGAAHLRDYRDLGAVNHYFLSFRPQSLHPGPHALDLRVKNRPEYKVKARKGYWVDAVVEQPNK